MQEQLLVINPTVEVLTQPISHQQLLQVADAAEQLNINGNLEMEQVAHGQMYLVQLARLIILARLHKLDNIEEQHAEALVLPIGFILMSLQKQSQQILQKLYCKRVNQNTVRVKRQR